MRSCFFLAVTECYYRTSSLESDAEKGEIFTQRPQQGQCWVGWSLQATDVLAYNETGARLGESYFTFAACILCDIWENFLCKLKPWTVYPLTDVFRSNNLTQKEQKHLFVMFWTGCILVDNENLMRFLEILMWKHEMVSLREAIFSTTAEKCPLSRLETVSLK